MVDRQRQRIIDGYVENTRTIRAFLETLTATKIADLLQINDQPAIPDSMPSGGGGDGSKSATEDTATERAALRGLPDEASTDEAYWTVNASGQRIRSDLWHRHNSPDPVGHQIDELFGNLLEMAGLSKMGAKVLVSIQHRPDLLKEKEQVMSRCNACQRWMSGGDPPESLADDIDDPLDVVAGYPRSGYCGGCWSAWDRLGRPDYPQRNDFERARANRHQDAKDTRPVERIDPVLDAMLASQRKSIMPVCSEEAAGQHIGA